MKNLSLEEKREQFHEFFIIKHPIQVNIITMPETFSSPDVENLVEYMPHAFVIASEMSEIATKALRPLRVLGEHAEELAAFLDLQNRKIDLMMSFILQQQDDKEHQYQGIEFGGSGVKVISDTEMPLEQVVEIKVFLTEEACAIFAYAEVIDCKQVDDKYHVSLTFSSIREQDQDILVKASLHIQTQQLKKRAKPRLEDN
ncbi:PilZ domain-containing protein [Alteromonadaceae bacterium M269]|nr:PilZ domain-containing protein [Alteromonadaceae bacterium M269]